MAGISRSLLAACALLLLVHCTPDPAPVAIPEPTPQPVPQAPLPAPEPNSFDPSGLVTLALLLPSGSGDEATDALAMSLSNAAQMAALELGSGQVIVNTYPTERDAARASIVAGAAIQDGARMLIGPVFAPSVRTVAPAAEAAGVPVLALSNNTNVRADGVWLLGLTFEERAHRVLAHAAANELLRVGVIHTSDAEGLVARDALRTAADATGTEIIVEAFYERSQEGIPAAAETFVGLMLANELDLVVMTDRDSGLIYAASFLPFYGLDTTDLQIASVQPLGDAIYSGERPLQGTWYAAPRAADLEAFSARYTELYGTDPHPLAPLAYEAVAVAVGLINDARLDGDTTPFGPENIVRSNGFVGPQGAFRLTPTGLTQRGLTVREVSRSGGAELGPPMLPPRQFGLGG